LALLTIFLIGLTIDRAYAFSKTLKHGLCSIMFNVYIDQIIGETMDALTKRVLMTIMVLGFVCCFICFYQPRDAYGGEMTDDMKKMQEQLNQEILSKPFSIADEARVKAYIEDAQRRGEVPPPYTGKHWRPGYTCVNLRPYSYREYLACRYYHSYYGRYYP
jgi:hypothetical protein